MNMDILKALLVTLILASTNNLEAKIALDIKWKEVGSQILQDSVCYNYNRIGRKYRFCRIEAKSLFKKRCENYRKKSKLVRKYKKPNALKKKAKPHTQNKYCVASRNFMILK